MHMSRRNGCLPGEGKIFLKISGGGVMVFGPMRRPLVHSDYGQALDEKVLTCKMMRPNL
jgi:hypothetical protein